MKTKSRIILCWVLTLFGIFTAPVQFMLIRSIFPFEWTEDVSLLYGLILGFFYVGLLIFMFAYTLTSIDMFQYGGVVPDKHDDV